MDKNETKSIKKTITKPVRVFYGFFAPRAYSLIIFGALFCTLAVKFFHAVRNDMVWRYPRWILIDVAVLVGIEVLFSAICFKWRNKMVIRIITFMAALICTWSVINASWLIRTGYQILPSVLLPLVRDPVNSMLMVVVNFIKMPGAAAALLIPSAIALSCFFYFLAKPVMPVFIRKKFLNRTAVLLAVILFALLIRLMSGKNYPVPAAAVDIPYNSQLRAITFIWDKDHRLTIKELAAATRQIPYHDQVSVDISSRRQGRDYNIVVVVLEGVQYFHTSLYDKENQRTPYMEKLAGEGVEFVNMRSSLTHTTKALFSFFSGHFPSASQDIAEAVPAEKPYASLATVLGENLNYKTAFFQSAKGDFEGRPGLVYNLGFQKFWSRDELEGKDDYVGYLGSDEFAMLEPITDWIKSDDRPFLLTVLTSVTHDPYEVPEWYGEIPKEHVEKYDQTIAYTDSFISALDVELKKLNLSENTIFCVVGDHGEAFGEHGFYAHDRISFEEALHVVWIMRAPFLIEPGTVVQEPVSSTDFAPTILSLLDVEVEGMALEGMDVLSPLPPDRKVHFSCWMQQGPSGYVIGDQKYIYNPANQLVTLYDMTEDPLELNGTELPEEESDILSANIIKWRKSTITKMNQPPKGSKRVFDSWVCHWSRWDRRSCAAKYRPMSD